MGLGLIDLQDLDFRVVGLGFRVLALGNGLCFLAVGFGWFGLRC